MWFFAGLCITSSNSVRRSDTRTGHRFCSVAFFQCKEVILPDAIGARLNVLVTGGADANFYPRGCADLTGVKSVDLLLDETDHVWYRVLPPFCALRTRPSHMSDVLMAAVAVRFVDAINPVVSHSCYPFIG